MVNGYSFAYPGGFEHPPLGALQPNGASFGKRLGLL